MSQVIRLTMFREPSVDGATLSRLFYGTEFICDVLEDVVREKPGVPVADWKVKGLTAIPAGIYEIVLENSPRFGNDTLTLKNVEGFQYIRIHAGNRSTDTEGCLLPGTRQGTNVVGRSREALFRLRDILLPHLWSKGTVEIEILNALEEA